MKDKNIGIVCVIQTIIILVLVIALVFMIRGNKTEKVSDTAGSVVQEENTGVHENVGQETTTSGDNSKAEAQEGNSSAGQNTVENTTNTEADAQNNSSAESVTQKGSTAQTADNTGISYTMTANSSWEGNGKTYVQYNVTVYNNTQADVNTWELEIDAASDMEIDNYWNCNARMGNGKILVEPVDYNSYIAKGGSMDGIGIVIGSTAPQNMTGSGETASQSSAATTPDQKAPSKTEQTVYGEGLRVDGTNIVDKDGNIVRLFGVSTHGLSWYPQYVNETAFSVLKDNFGVNTIRLAMYTEEYNGYCSGGSQQDLKKLIYNGVEYATKLDMYAIIDWHILNDGNPNTHKEEAIAFFDEVSKKYKDYDNVLYEICNEPNGGVSWADIKSYAEEVIAVIRANDADGIIIVGTPTWSQDVDAAAKDPITGYDNIMYTLHFYAATHKDDLRRKAETALSAGLPLMVTEFSICDASGNGGIDYTSADAWLKLIDKYNLSYVGWNLSNKNETSALLKTSVSKSDSFKWEDFSDWGKWLFESFMN